MNPEDKPMGIYLELFHGRTDPEQDMEDWGEQGPFLGPLAYAHTTYKSDLKIAYVDADGKYQEDFVRFFEDMIYYDGVFYGDWSVTTLERCEADRIQRFDAAKAKLPDQWVKSLEERHNKRKTRYMLQTYHSSEGHGDPRVPVMVEGGQGLTVTLPANSLGDEPYLYVERQPGLWSINLNPDTTDIVVQIKLTDAGAVTVTDRQCQVVMHEDAPEVTYRNYYRHEDCEKQPGVEWQDDWTAMCNDRCPACNKEIEPYRSEEIGRTQPDNINKGGFAMGESIPHDNPPARSPEPPSGGVNIRPEDREF